MAIGTLTVLAGVAFIGLANSYIISRWSLGDKKIIGEVLEKVVEGKPITLSEVVIAEEAYKKWQNITKTGYVSKIEESDQAMLEVMRRIREYDNIVDET